MMGKIIFDIGSVFLGNNILNELNSFLKDNYYLSKKFVLVDENIIKFCFPLFKDLELLTESKIIEIKCGEKNKNIDTILKIWDELTLGDADRKSLLINFGGGVITDLGGFAASTYKRGIDFINIPTTLLSQVDSSIGGKTGIDFLSKNNIILKNQIGVFNNPKAVFILPAFLKTLEEREFLSGLAEIIKHSLIGDRDYWNDIKNFFFYSVIDFDDEKVEKFILRSLEIKSEIVLKDPREIGLRKILNFGHTIGHAIESLSLKNDKIPLLHGEAIAIGMVCECYLSNKISGLCKDDLDDIVCFIRNKYSYYKLNNKKFNDLIEIMKGDKKNENDKINFSLLSKIGNCVINQKCSDSLILESFNFYNNQ